MGSKLPGAYILGDSLRHIEVKNYIKGIVTHFADDQRVIGWDLYNEPGNLNAGFLGMMNLRLKKIKIFIHYLYLKKPLNG